MDLQTFWFILIVVLWIGYFVLEGFDFGVGILLPVLGRSEAERRVMVNTIGPVWDGNEVWLLVAGGATFAAFPQWYATLFSAAYLALFVILLALIVRGVAFEYRSKRPDSEWRSRWDWMIFIGSLVPALLWGVAFGNVVRGLPLDSSFEYTGNFFTLLNPYALLGGITTLLLFTTHGAVYTALKTRGDLHDRARDLAWKVGLGAAVAAVAFLLWSQAFSNRSLITLVISLAAAACLVVALLMVRADREGWAFVFTALTLGLAVITLFTGLYPDVLPSTTDPATNSLTIYNASSSPYTLKVMTWVAVLFTPVVLAYQAWTYWVFRRRLSTDNIPEHLAAFNYPAPATVPAQTEIKEELTR